MYFRIVAGLLLALSINSARASEDLSAEAPAGVQAISLLGEPLRSAIPSQETLDKLAAARAEFEADPTDADRIIWLGRRLAYAGDYRGAIEVYSRGIGLHPGDARLYRHRGHRYVTVRELERAVADLEQAAGLVEGTEDEVEPDGLPNALDIPVSSLHGNIWYHLGLAHYLRRDWRQALEAFDAGHAISRNDDNRVSTTHWRYMILRRLGRDKEARRILGGISADMEVIENHVYHRLCLFYKGELSEGDMGETGADDPTGSAAAYGIANWHLYSGRKEEAQRRMRRIIAGRSWAAFGYIAAEAELAANR